MVLVMVNKEYWWPGWSWSWLQASSPHLGPRRKTVLLCAAISPGRMWSPHLTPFARLTCSLEVKHMVRDNTRTTSKMLTVAETSQSIKAEMKDLLLFCY